MTTIKLIIKTIITIIIIVMYKIIQSMLPIIQNTVAIIQMDNTIESGIGMPMYNLMYNTFRYLWIVLVIFILTLFSDEIVEIYNIIKEKLNEKH